MTVYELIKRVYWILDEWIASSLGLGDYYSADGDDGESKEDADDEEPEEIEEQIDDLVDEDDGYDDMYKYHDHQA